MTMDTKHSPLHLLIIVISKEGDAFLLREEQLERALHTVKSVELVRIGWTSVGGLAILIVFNTNSFSKIDSSYRLLRDIVKGD